MKKIPKEISEIASYLSYVFGRTMHSSIHTEKDLFNDLVVYYIENYKKDITKNQWYVFFKNYLIDKYRRSKREIQILGEYAKNLKVSKKIKNDTEHQIFEISLD